MVHNKYISKLIMTQETKPLPIVLKPDPVLDKNTEIIKNPLDPYVQQLAKNMFATMEKEGKHAVGLSAPQVASSLRLCVIRLDNTHTTLINPQIIKTYREQILVPEMCLSIPNEEFNIIRYEKIMLQYTNEKGITYKIKAKNFLAILLQHELDHLDGILMSKKYEQQAELRKLYNVTE